LARFSREMLGSRSGRSASEGTLELVRGSRHDDWSPGLPRRIRSGDLYAGS
jgi:hypothetical protein